VGGQGRQQTIGKSELAEASATPSIDERCFSFHRRAARDRIPDIRTLADEIAAWRADKQKEPHEADWQFTAADGRIKLKRLYSTL
jgi:hypothetical protein